MEKTIKEVAQEILDNMEYKTRTNGNGFYCMKNHNIEWQTEIIREAHRDRMPNDFIYDVIHETLEMITECDTEDEAEDRISDIEADIYTSNLCEWLGDNNNNVYYLTQALEEFDIKDGFQALAMAQKIHKDEIAWDIIHGVSDYVDNQE